jgi:hypothetical protein
MPLYVILCLCVCLVARQRRIIPVLYGTLVCCARLCENEKGGEVAQPREPTNESCSG